MPQPSSHEQFDTRTHTTDSLSGKTKLANAYRLYVLQGKDSEGRDSAVRYFERPVGSGNLWFENNKPAGRLLGPNQVNTEAPHIEWIAPPTGAELVARELADAKRELAAIKAEQNRIIAKAQSDADTKKAAPEKKRD